MSELTPEDVLRWDPGIILQLFGSTIGLHEKTEIFGDDLADAQQLLAEWHGEGADALHEDLGQQRHDIDDTGYEYQAVATVVRRSYDDVRGCYYDMWTIQKVANRSNWAVQSGWTIDTSGQNELGEKADAQSWQKKLTALHSRAVTADEELAAAVRSAIAGSPQITLAPRGGGPPQEQDGSKLTPEEQEEVGKWSQFSVENGGGDCSRWAIASALANEYGVREGPNGKEINLPADVQDSMMGGMPLHFRPTKAEINQITAKQGVQPTAGGENYGFPGGPDLMSRQLSQFGVHSTSHMSNDVPGLMNQLDADLRSGHFAIVNGAPEPGGGHFLSVTGLHTGPNGETLYLVNDSNRMGNGGLNTYGTTIPYPCTRQQLMTFLQNRVSAGMPGYSTVG